MKKIHHPNNSIKAMIIDTSLVRRLIASQFPEWKELSIDPVATGGWDNRTFHLGKDMSVRLPSAAAYELQVEKEHQWLPKLAPALPLQIPLPLAMGRPEYGYPWKWSIYRWLEGETAASRKIADKAQCATDPAHFLQALYKVDATGGPPPGLHSFHRGGSLSVYDHQTRRCITALKDRIDVSMATTIWQAALSTSWKQQPVWVHGDISASNLLLRDGTLSAVIDFGQLAVGDPACDLAISWTFFQGKSRDAFHLALPLDQGTWARARGWALWKALVTLESLTHPNTLASQQCIRTIEEVMADHQKSI